MHRYSAAIRAVYKESLRKMTSKDAPVIMIRLIKAHGDTKLTILYGIKGQSIKVNPPTHLINFRICEISH